MRKKVLFLISFIGLIAGLIAMSNTYNNYQSDVKAINEHHDNCVDYANDINQRAAKLDSMDNSFVRDDLVDEHNYQVAQYNAVCS